MAVPGFQDLMLPFLQICRDGKERTVSEIGEVIAAQFGLSDDDLKETMSSGQTKFYNRTAWVKSYFGKAGLLDFPSRGKFKITNRGLDLLRTDPAAIRIKTLRQYPEFIDFIGKSTDPATQDHLLDALVIDTQTVTPEELFEDSYQKLQNQLASSLLEVILNNPPNFC